MMTGLRLCGWSPGLIWTDEMPPLYLDAVSLAFTDNITIVHILTMKTESQILKPKCFFVCIDGWMLWIDDIVYMYL